MEKNKINHINFICLTFQCILNYIYLRRLPLSLIHMTVEYLFICNLEYVNFTMFFILPIVW